MPDLIRRGKAAVQHLRQRLALHRAVLGGDGGIQLDGANLIFVIVRFGLAVCIGQRRLGCGKVILLRRCLRRLQSLDHVGRDIELGRSALLVLLLRRHRGRANSAAGDRKSQGKRHGGYKTHDHLLLCALGKGAA